VSFLSETEMELFLPLCGENVHEMGVSFEMKQCVPETHNTHVILEISASTYSRAEVRTSLGR
jgi:hypothetical protein